MVAPHDFALGRGHGFADPERLGTHRRLAPRLALHVLRHVIHAIDQAFAARFHDFAL